MPAIPTIFAADVELLPSALRAVLDAELASGNEVAGTTHSFPAPPCGVAIQLARPLSWTLPADQSQVQSCRFPAWDGSAGFSCPKRHFFVLGPESPEPEPEPQPPPKPAPPVTSPVPAAAPSPVSDVIRRFHQSLSIDFDKWKDGIGYDLQAIEDASPSERRDIENSLLSRGIDGWRDVEALSQFDTPRVRKMLRAALKHPKTEVRLAVLEHAPDLAPPARRASILVRALKESEFFGGLTQALDLAAEFHPPSVERALWHCLANREVNVVASFAALLCHIHGLTPHRFDWDQRPYFLSFAVEDRKVRRQRIAELRQRLIKP